MKKRILVIDDEVVVLDVIHALLEEMGYVVSSFSSAEAGETAGTSDDFDLIITDLRMPGRTGDELTRNILSVKPKAKILINTGYPDDPLVDRALQNGATAVLKKPYEIAKIVDYLR